MFVCLSFLCVDNAYRVCRYIGARSFTSRITGAGLEMQRRTLYVNNLKVRRRKCSRLRRQQKHTPKIAQSGGFLGGQATNCRLLLSYE